MQLDDKDPTDYVRPNQKVSDLSILARATLVTLATTNDLSSPASRANRSCAVQAMTDLCRRAESPQSRRRPRSTPPRELIPSDLSTEPQKALDPNSFNLRCLPFQCLFCLGDKRLILADRTHSFNRQQALWKHVRKHRSYR